jgi:Tat protein translocase TatB subunit
MNGFFGVGPLELLVIGILALIFIGPARLPGVIAQVMKTVRELRAYAEEARGALTAEIEPLREEFEGVTRDVNEFARDISASANEITAEAQQAMNTAQQGVVLNAPAMPTEPPQTKDEHPLFPSLIPPPAMHTNGVNGAVHDEDEERPAFTDYRPG